MKTLHLTLHRHWFDEIASGRKTTEYRAKSAFWKKRLIGRTFERIIFRNGYAKNCPKMEVEWRGMADARFQGQSCFGIQLGKIITIENYQT